MAMIDWQRMWNDDEKISRFSPTRAILYVLSLLYRLIADLRNWLYDKQIISAVKLACPVISVGNITVGGTGKTPCVIMLARILQARGFRCAVISRGYGGKNPQKTNIVSDGKTILLNAETAGDEPLLIARSLPGVPVITGARRIKTGKAAIDQFGVDVLICDDAFQHREIARDIDLVLLDSEKPLGNGRLLPRGELRESAAGLSRADCFILTRSEQAQPVDPVVDGIAQSSNVPIFRAAHQPQDLTKGDKSASWPISELQGKKICAFCGIARPESFKKILLKSDADIISFHPFPDHYSYSLYDLEELKSIYLNSGADYLVTTEKDVMRLRRYPEYLKILYALRIEMQIVPSSGLFEHFIMRQLKKPIKKGKVAIKYKKVIR
jgi:tetraacyldisaccharide 4'-kinase